ncbi:hypothetical protein K9M47_02770 [Candidatus Gracilibacteria bacterium]|nr:hypothetical protein [Candidatus Gracilibacteria bacterium]
MYINQKFIDKWNADSILLEIKLPRDIMKSPLATETAIASLLQTGGISTWYAREFSGNLPAYSSLEIASLEGTLHFYVRINKKYKHLVESNFYAQYPGIEIVEADDYTKLIRYHHLSKDVSIWGSNYTLGKKWKPVNEKTGKKYSKSGKSEPKDDKDEYEMPADFFPIKTYVDYGLDKDPKEEFKTDPITPLLEFMGSIGKGEYFWYQVLVQDEGVYSGSKMPKFYVNEQTHEHVSLSKMADTHKKQIRTASHFIEGKPFLDKYGDPEMKKSGKKDEDGKDIMIEALYPKTKVENKKDMDLTQEEKDEIESINKKLSKPLALVVVRLVYVAKKESFNSNHIQNILSFPKPYKGVNSFNPSGVTDPYDFPWQKIGGKRVNWRSEEKFDAYVEREGFFPHIKERKSLDSWEDMIFYSYSMKTRKVFRMLVEAIFFPFDHPHPSDVSILNLEEIATLWHLPGQVAGTPTLPRIDSNKGMAPTNLPQ